MVLQKIKKTIENRIKNPMGRDVKVTPQKRDRIVIKRLEKIFSSEEATEAIKHCRRIVKKIDAENHNSSLNSLIDFTLPLHDFRKTFKPELRFIESHINGFKKIPKPEIRFTKAYLDGLGEGPISDFIRVINGDYQSIHIYFATKIFSNQGFEGMKITFKGKDFTLGELRQRVLNNDAITIYDRNLMNSLRGYMSRMIQLLEYMQNKTYTY